MASIYPPVSFFFRVNFEGEQFPAETSFQSVNGLSVDMQTESLKEGGENRFEHILPVRTKYNSLVLKRGLLKDSEIIQWCMDAILNFDIRPMNLLVNLLTVKSGDGNQPSEGDEPLMSWKVINAWPKKWLVSEFNAEQNSMAIETLELNYSYFETV